MLSDAAHDVAVGKVRGERLQWSSMSCAVVLTLRPDLDVAHAEARHENVPALQGDGRIAGNDEELRDFRQSGDDVFGDAIRETFGVAAHLGERPRSDGRLIRQC